MFVRETKLCSTRKSLVKKGKIRYGVLLLNCSKLVIYPDILNTVLLDTGQCGTINRCANITLLVSS